MPNAPRGVTPTGITPTSAAHNAKRRKDKRRRIQEKFWLDARNPREKALGKALETKKARRLYHATIRDGVEILLALEVGDPTPLLRRFPTLYRDLTIYLTNGN